MNNLVTAFRNNFNNNKELRRAIGGFKRGAKSQVKFDRVQAIKEKEAIRKLNQWSIQWTYLNIDILFFDLNKIIC